MSQKESSQFTRRDFVKAGSFATMMAMMGGVPLMAQPAETAAPEEPKPKIKVGLVGLGIWGRSILDELARLPNAEISAICDNYPPMVRRSARQSPSAKQFEDHNLLLADQDIQAVIVATPTHLHREIVEAALRAGKHVYCEAPLAQTVEDTKAIALAAREAVGQVFQAGLQVRSDPQRHWLLPFIRGGALGKFVMVRAQWHKKSSWRSASPNPDREVAANWRLKEETSLGLAGEIAMHALDQAGWFMGQLPTAVTGFGSNILWNDGRTVADTIQLVLDYVEGARLVYDATLANSFDAEYEIYHGTNAAVMLRDGQAWMFKEVDSPLLGWEVYARKDKFYQETGIALVAGGSKQDRLAGAGVQQSAFPMPPLYYALEAFLNNCADVNQAVQTFKENFGEAEKSVLREYLAAIERPRGDEVSDTSRAKEDVTRYAPGADLGYAATILAIKASEAVRAGKRIELAPGLFELA